MGKEASVRITLAALALAVAGCEASTPQPPDRSVTSAALTHTWTPEPSATLTLTPTPTESPTLEPTPTPELGGDQVRVVFRFSRGRGGSYEMRPEVAPYLVPTTPEEWVTLPVYTTSDGSRLPWGKLVDVSGYGEHTIFAARLRGMPMIPGHYSGANMYFPVLEFPAVGGSNFYIPELWDSHSNPDNALSYWPSSGFPMEWLESPSPLSLLTITWAPGLLDQGEIIELWRPHIGEMVLIMLRSDLSGVHPIIGGMIQDIAAGRLMTTDQPEFIPIGNLFFPAPP